MELHREPIDFKAIAAETGVRQGRVAESDRWGWVVIGHPDIDMICIDTPKKKGDLINGTPVKNIRIEDGNWVYEG